MKQSNNQYFWTKKLDKFFKGSQKCANFVDMHLVIHISTIFACLSDFYSPMTKLLKYEI